MAPTQVAEAHDRRAEGAFRLARSTPGYGSVRTPHPPAFNPSQISPCQHVAIPCTNVFLNSFEFESWKKAELWQKEQQDKENPKRNSGEEPDHKLRAAFKEQAQALQANKETWRPTWKALGLEPHEVAKSTRTVPSTQPGWYARQRKAGSK